MCLYVHTVPAIAQIHTYREKAEYECEIRKILNEDKMKHIYLWDKINLIRLFFRVFYDLIYRIIFSDVNSC